MLLSSSMSSVGSRWRKQPVVSMMRKNLRGFDGRKVLHNLICLILLNSLSLYNIYIYICVYVYYIKYVHIYMYTYIWNLKYSRKHQGYMLWLYNGIGRVLPTSLMGCSGEIVVRIINRCKSLIFHWRNSGYIVGIKPSDGHFIKMPIEFHIRMYIYIMYYILIIQTRHDE